MRLHDRARFVELMRLKGMSQRQLADRAHVSQGFVSLLVQGQRGARPETAWRIAAVMGVYTEELFTSDPPSAEDSPLLWGRPAALATAGSACARPSSPTRGAE
ncbi:helix-turn-helix transcriptional regulator [Streptomyces chartreusis]|uniref:helix-turn-helix domain-containing protein n=1 Tax=Streptomyces chartreusis TaxID=1969 RepID=UPI002E193999